VSLVHALHGNSDRVVQRAELTFQTLALNRRLSEAFPEVVLRPVASPVSTVSDHRHHHFLVLLVIGKHFLESFAKCVEIAVSDCPCLEDGRLELCHSEIVQINAVSSLTFGSAVLRLEEVAVGAGHEGVDLVVGEVGAGGCSSFGSFCPTSCHFSVQSLVAHGTGKEALLCSNLILIHVFGEVAIVTLRNHVLVFH